MRSIFSRRALVMAGAVLGALALAPAASDAATVTLSQQSSSIFGTNGHSNVTIKDAPATPLYVAAGGFALTDGTDSFTAWCLDVSTWIRLPSLYDQTLTPFPTEALGAAQVANVKRLFNTAYAGLDLTKAVASAGFQLALWELVNETGPAFTLSSGSFTAWNNTAAVAFANTLLAGLSGPVTGHYHFTFLASNDPRAKDGHYSQNLVTVAEAPLPAAGWLLVAALGAVGALRRRR